MRADIHDGQEHKRSMQGPDTEAQDHPPFVQIRLATHGRSIQMCHFRTHASQQSKPYSITFVRAGEHRCRQIEAERLGGFQIDHQLVLWSASAPADQPASLRPLSARSWAMQERPQRQRPLRPKLGRSCRAVLAGASASVKSDAKCPRCLALHFWI